MCRERHASPPAASQNCKFAMQLPVQQDFGFLRRAVELALAEADEREIELTARKISSRLFSVYDRGVRDEEALKDAIVFNLPAVHLH